MVRYRNDRSAVHLPDSQELDAVLTRLVEFDPSNRNVWLAQRAELAWDRGDDRACEQLATDVFSADAGHEGATRFSRDPSAPQQVLARLLELSLRRKVPSESRRFAEFAVSERFAGPECAGPLGWLELLVHRALSEDSPDGSAVK